MTFRADRLRTLREQKGFSGRELARLCGLGETMISKYEKDQAEPTTTSLKEMAKILNVSADYLIGIVDEPRGYLSDDELDPNERAMLETYRREGWHGVVRLGVDHLS